MPGRIIIRATNGSKVISPDGSTRPVTEDEKDILVENAENEVFTHKDKQKLKNTLKSQTKKKFIVGQKYMLKTKPREGSEVISKTFILKKFIYSIEDRPIKILILKQIGGYVSNMHTINRDDCKMLHIKYEPGLQVWSMELNWRLVKDK